MILQEKIKIKIVPNNIKYWKDRGYDVSLNTEHEVYVNDLPSKSNYTVLCECETCNRKYIQRISRDKNICGYCKSSSRMKGNKLGQKNLKHKSPEKQDLQELLLEGHGKSYIAKKYNVKIPVVNRWLKENDIEIERYQGRKYFKSKEKENEVIEKINDLIEQNHNIESISKLVEVPRHILTKLRKENKISIESQFSIWNKKYEEILSNIDEYVRLNESKTLIDISIEKDISVEHLKKAFRESGNNVKLHSSNKSKGELECKDFIRTMIPNCHSAIINKLYEIDCYVHEKSFGVEYCGEFWHRFQPSKDNKNYHKRKFKFCEQNNIDLMTIFECEWKNKRSLVESMIRSRLGFNDKIFARKCEVKNISSRDANLFHDKNHISGKLNSSINIGLYFKNELVSVLSIVKSRYDKNYQYEISRFSTKQNITVVGGLSKMFSHFIKTYNPESCMTYADLRFGKGECYSKIGFEYLNDTVPNYFYFDKRVGDKLESRFQFQKHKLKNLNNYSAEKTEYEIMNENGWYRLYDCGNKKYGWKKKTTL